MVLNLIPRTWHKGTKKWMELNKWRYLGKCGALHLFLCSVKHRGVCLFMIGNRRAVWYLSSLQLQMSYAKYQVFFRCLSFGLNHLVSGKKNPIVCGWKQALVFVNWVFIYIATTLHIKMLILCMQMGTCTKQGSKRGFFCLAILADLSKWNATVPLGLPQKRKTFIENVFFIL